MEAKFLAKLKEDRLTQKDNSFCFSLNKYKETIKRVKCAKLKQIKESADYKLIKRFDVIEVAELERLIVPVKENSEIIYFVHDEELFGILSNVHTSVGHGGRDKMMKELKRKYKNITYKDVNIFLSVCEPCMKKLKREKKEIVTKPLSLKELDSRCHVNLIDYQSQPDGEFKFIMIYQDHITKFVVLKALQSNKGEEVANNLIDIFTLLGAPIVLQSENEREFGNNIIEVLKLLWPDLKLVNGKPRYSQSQDYVECVNEDVRNKISNWMQVNKTSQWSKGLRFVQLMKNKTYYPGIKKSPYEALFGHPLRLGLSTSGIPQEAIAAVQEEDELEDAINSITSAGVKSSPDENEKMEVILLKEESIEDQGLEYNEDFVSEYLEMPTTVKNHQQFVLCIVCQSDCTLNSNNKCCICEHYFHVACGFPRNSENYVCAICFNNELVKKECSLWLDGLEPQAKRMKKLSDKHLHPIERGSTLE